MNGGNGNNGIGELKAYCWFSVNTAYTDGSIPSIHISANQAMVISTCMNCFNVLATMQPRSAIRTILSI